MSAQLQKCFSEAKINGLTLSNRLIKAATCEGKAPDGVPGEQLTRFHNRFAEGGIGMTTIGYCAAESDGRVTDQMLYMEESVRPQMEAMVSAIQAAGTRVSGQLSHCGNFSKNHHFKGKRPLGPSAGINMLGLVNGLPFISAMNKADIDQRVKVFADAAAYMKSVGFDAIEIHFGHGYGISQFISPKTNKRKDEYGGSLINRMRLPLRILEAVREAVGDEYLLLAKISMSDGVRGGVSYDEAVEIAVLLDQGGIDAIICSGGTSSMNPMLVFRGDSMVNGLLEQEKNPLMKIGLRFMGPKMFREYPYSDLYFLEQAQRIRERVKCNVVYIGGCCSGCDLNLMWRFSP